MAGAAFATVFPGRFDVARLPFPAPLRFVVFLAAMRKTLPAEASRIMRIRAGGTWTLALGPPRCEAPSMSTLTITIWSDYV